MRLSSDKSLLKAYNKNRWDEFIQDNDPEMLLPEVSIMYRRSATKKLDKFEKTIIPNPNENDCHVKVITKNGKPEAYVWQTTPEKLALGVRWGIIHVESLTSKVISALGQYRITAHEIIAKGMISNSHAIKIALLDSYQDRFEKLQALESLVNQDNTEDEITAALDAYINEMVDLKAGLHNKLKAADFEAIVPKALQRLVDDVDADIQRAQHFKLKTKAGNLRAINRAKGYYSILEFVKDQMTYNLAEMQGLNQDITYSLEKTFALTRGRMNDYILDAQKLINDHEPDFRNGVNAKHHGHFDATHRVIYDFSADGLSPEKERQAMLAVSFIEGWDRVDSTDRLHPVLQSNQQTYPLKTIAATRWRVARDLPSFGRKIGNMLFNMLKNLVTSTQSWKENEPKAYRDADKFQMVSYELNAHSKENLSIWQMLGKGIKRAAIGLKDIGFGVYHAGKSVSHDTFIDLRSDWESSKKAGDFETVIRAADEHINAMHTAEKDNLDRVFHNVINTGENKRFVTLDDLKRKDVGPHLANISIAHQDYHLTASEANDILNSVLRGVTGFSEVFTHDLFAKNPVAGCAFLASYGLAAAAIIAPTYVSFLGSKLIALQNQLGSLLAGSKFSAAISVASLESQLASMALDGVMHGPSGQIGHLASEFTNSTLKLSVMLAVAYTAGRLLADGVNGYRIPGVVGEVLHEEANGNHLNYLILGAKFLIVTKELTEKGEKHKFSKEELAIHEELLASNRDEVNQYKQKIQQYIFVKWLSDNYKKIPKLPFQMRCNIEKHIESQFPVDDALALKKIIRHEEPRSIAFYLIAIPLTYITSLARIFINAGMSFVALCKGSEHPGRPLKNGFVALGRQLSKDTSRLAMFAFSLTRLVSHGFTSLIKMVVVVGMLAVGRLAALINFQPGHATHRVMAKAHVAWRTLGAILYPSRIIKHNVSANPKSVVNKYETSYKKLHAQWQIDRDRAQPSLLLKRGSMDGDSLDIAPLRNERGNHHEPLRDSAFEPVDVFASGNASADQARPEARIY
jgi:hypothetical protein